MPTTNPFLWETQSTSFYRTFQLLYNLHDAGIPTWEVISKTGLESVKQAGENILTTTWHHIHKPGAWNSHRNATTLLINTSLWPTTRSNGRKAASLCSACWGHRGGSSRHPPFHFWFIRKPLSGHGQEQLHSHTPHKLCGPLWDVVLRPQTPTCPRNEKQIRHTLQWQQTPGSTQKSKTHPPGLTGFYFLEHRRNQPKSLGGACNRVLPQNICRGFPFLGKKVWVSQNFF